MGIVLTIQPSSGYHKHTILWHTCKVAFKTEVHTKPEQKVGSSTQCWFCTLMKRTHKKSVQNNISSFVMRLLMESLTSKIEFFNSFSFQEEQNGNRIGRVKTWIIVTEWSADGGYPTKDGIKSRTGTMAGMLSKISLYVML